MDYETAVAQLGRHQVYACCEPFLGHELGDRLLGDDLRNEPLLTGGKDADGFDLVDADGQLWLVQDDRVVLRPAPVAGSVQEHELSDAVEVMFRTRGLHLVASRDSFGWSAGFGSAPAHGSTLEGAIQNLLRR